MVTAVTMAAPASAKAGLEAVVRGGSDADMVLADDVTSHADRRPREDVVDRTTGAPVASSRTNSTARRLTAASRKAS
jgi:hypothetical protein